MSQDDTTKTEETPIEEDTEIEEVLEDSELPIEEDAPVEEVTEEELEDVTDTKAALPDFRPGDTVRVLYKIIEGSKERVQPYEGIVIAKKGSGVSKTFTVRRIGADRVGIERIFPLFTPNIVKLEVKRKGKVRRAKLYYLRTKIGRAATRVKERK